MRNLRPWTHTSKPASTAGWRLPHAGELAVAPGVQSNNMCLETPSYRRASNPHPHNFPHLPPTFSLSPLLVCLQPWLPFPHSPMCRPPIVSMMWPQAIKEIGRNNADNRQTRQGQRMAMQTDKQIRQDRQPDRQRDKTHQTGARDRERYRENKRDNYI